MQCWIYKGRRRNQTYLYLGAEDATDSVPDELLQAMGPLQLVMELELSTDSVLARAKPLDVMRRIHECGYYLQLPPADGPTVDRLGPVRLQ